MRRFLGVSTVRGATVMAAAMIVTLAVLGVGLVLGAARPPAVTIASQAVTDGEPLPELTGAVDATEELADPPSQQDPTTTTVATEAAGEAQTHNESATTTTEPQSPTTPPTTVPSAASSEPVEEVQQLASPVTVSIIGDSVVAGAQGALEAVFGEEVVIDATVSRQFRHTSEVVADLVRDGLLGDVVIVHLGTNGAFSDGTFDEAMQSLEGKNVVVVNTKVPRRWEGAVNGAIDAGKERWPSVQVADWHSLAVQHPEWFLDDLVHLNPTGQQAYAEFLFAAAHD